jgi:hypothetical protein
MLLRGSLQLARRRWLEGMRSGLEALRKLGRATRDAIEEMAATIRSWGKYRAELKEAVAKILFEEAERIAMARPDPRRPEGPATRHNSPMMAHRGDDDRRRP